eukprot:EG_transcript_8908
MDSRKRQRTEIEEAQPEGDKLYFDSYANIGIHEAMLRDTVRTEGYYNAIMHHKKRFEGKVVVDVGCGTSILSIFCAWAGAKHVYAIEASRMSEHARNVVAENGLQDTITIVQGKVEEVDLVDRDGCPVVADIIISEWMGYFLYYESMFESVLLARDRWLAPDGILFPSHAVLYVAPLTDDPYYADRVYFWQALYGANMRSLFDHARKCAFDNVIIDTVQPYQCFASSQIIKFVDCRTCTVEEVQNFQASFAFKSTIVTNFHGFVGWFSTLFTTEEEIRAVLGPKGQTLANGTCQEDQEVCSSALTPGSALLLTKLRQRDPALAAFHTLSTSPEDFPTHWQQTLFFTGDQLLMVQDQELVGEIVVGQCDENKRFLDIRIHWTLVPHEETPNWTAPRTGRWPTAKPVPRRPLLNGRYGAPGYGYQSPYPAVPGYANPYGPPAYGAPGYADMLPSPDTQNQHEEPNPPLSSSFAHSKLFGFK